MPNPARLVLVDGTSLIYRAFFALPSNLSTAGGLHTNAIYGFATMYRKMFAGRRPDYGAVVFDPPGKTFRDEKYSEYKAQRTPMADELREQLQHIDRLVDAHEFPRLRVPGFEADDVIGTLARMAVEQGMEVHIISGDKDFAQLISDEVRMIDSLRDITYDAELVRKKWGVVPEQFVDLLALMGDKIDNIPGVPGIGQKGAAGLLQKYESLDGILEHVDELKGRQKTALTEHRADAELSRDLATIDRHVPLEVSLEDLALPAPDAAAINALFRELEFYSLLSEEEEAAAREAERQDADYRTVETVRGLEEELAALPEGACAVHPIFDGWTPVRGALAGVTLSAEGGRAFYVPIKGDGALADEALALLKPWLESESQPKIVHNAKQLWICLRRLEIELRGPVFDVLLASFLIDPVRIIPHRLDQMSKEFLQRTVQPAKTVVGSGKKEIEFSEASAQDLGAYACHLVDAIWQMAPKVEARLTEEGQRKNYDELDLPLSWVLGQMELDGIRVDEEDLDRLGQEFRAKLSEYESQIHGIAGHEFNIASPKQLSKVLFEELELPVIKRTKSGYSTNAEVLERLAPKHEIAQLLLEQRKLAKLINTYTDVLTRERWEVTGRIHTTIQQTVARSGRLITTEPDLQRTPVKTPEGKRIRKAFVPRDGWQLISADWSQIELRLLAHITKDEMLVEAFAKDLDVHSRTAAQLFGCTPEQVEPQQRAVGKLVNFSTIYGQGATALGQIVGVPRKEAQRYIDDYFSAYHGVREWLDQTIAQAHADGYVTTILGRRRYIPELSSKNFMERQAGERIAGNTPIQGSAADICKLAMLGIAEELRSRKLAGKMMLQIHDELLFECPPEEVEEISNLARDKMEHVYPLDVPLKVDVGVGASWADAK
jgi:DNA polymerase-1